MDIYDPQTLGIMVFGGFMVISAIGIVLVSSFSMKETSYEEALAKQRRGQGAQPPRLEKKKKDKASEKKNRGKKEDKPNGKIPEAEESVPEVPVAEPVPEPAAAAPVVAAAAPEPPAVPEPAPAPEPKVAAAPSLCVVDAPPAPSPKGKRKKKAAKVEPPAPQAAAPAKAVPEPAPAPEPKVAAAPSQSVVDAPPAPSPKEKRKKKAAKVEPAPQAAAPAKAKPEPAPVMSAPAKAKPEPAPVMSAPAKAKPEPAPVKSAPAPTPAKATAAKSKTAPAQTKAALPPAKSSAAPSKSAPPSKTEAVTKEVPVMVTALAAAPAKAQEQRKKASKKKAEPVAAVDSADAPLYLPYKALGSTISSMVFSEGEAQRLIEILSEKVGIIQDAWHTAAQKGDPVAMMKKLLDEKERQLATEQEDSAAANGRLRELSKELSAEKSKVASVETRLSSQLSKREQEMIALQARMQASYQDHVAQTQELNAKILSVQDKLEKGPNAQLARLQQENSILRDALNQATSQAESKQNVELAKLHQDCTKLTKELGEKTESLQADERVKRGLEAKVSATEKQLTLLQAAHVESEQALQRRLEDVSEELRTAQSSNISLKASVEQGQQDGSALSALQVETLTAQLEQTKEEKSMLEQQVSAINTLLEASQSKEEEEDDRQAAHVESEQALQRRLEDVSEELRTAQSSNISLKASVEQGQQDGSALSDLQVLMGSTEAQLGEQSAQVEALTAQLEQTKEEKSMLEQQVSAINTLLEASQGNSAEYEQLTLSLQERDDQLASLHEELKQLQMKQEAAQESRSEPEQTTNGEDLVASLQDELKKLREEMEQLKNTPQSDNSAELSLLQSSLTERDGLLTSLQEELREAKENSTAVDNGLMEQLTSFHTEAKESLQTLFPQILIESEQSNWLQDFTQKAQESLSQSQQSQESPSSMEQPELLGKLKEGEESSLQAECEQYRTVLAETEGMLQDLQKSVEEEELVWKSKMTDSEEQLRGALEQVSMLLEAAEILKTEDQSIEKLKEQMLLLEAQLEKQSESACSDTQGFSEEMTQLNELLAQTQNQLETSQKEAQAHKEQLAQVRDQLSEVKQPAQPEQNGAAEPHPSQVQRDRSLGKEKLRDSDALRLQLAEEFEQAQRTVLELQAELGLLQAAGDAPQADTEDVTQLKERLGKEKKLSRDLGQAATKLQQLLQATQEQLTQERNTVRTLQEHLEGQGDYLELKEGTSV